MLTLHLFQDLIQDIQIQLADQLGAFQDRDKIGRREQAFFRVDPAGQGFLVADPAVGSPDDGLVVHPDPFFFNGPVQVVEDILAVIGLGQHVFVKVIKTGSILVPVHITGIFRPVAGSCHRHRFNAGEVDACPHRQAVPVVEELAFVKYSIQRVFQAFLVGKARKIILGKAAAVFVAEMLHQNSRETGQQLIPFGITVLAVVILHPVQVEVQEDRFLSLFLQAKPSRFRQLEEITHGGQSGEMVVVIFAEQGPFLKRAGIGLVQVAF